MARLIKLPPELKDWKVDSLVKSDSESGIYKVIKENENGETVNAVLRVISLNKDNYSEDRAAFFEEEANFIASLKSIGDSSNYIDVFVKNSPSRLSCDLYIFTEDLQSFDMVMKQKSFSEEEVVDFGIKMSEILEKLEAESIFHGNIAPQNIFVTADGCCKLGGFSDLESKIDGTSFMSPEVYKHEQADFTTDIYSLGIIMYTLCNNGRLPFENDEMSKKSANEKRLSGMAVSAPANGGEKLKSVVIIACQPDNSARWKNASNIKNALLSIKSEISQKKSDSKIDKASDTDNAALAAAAAAGAVIAGTDGTDNIADAQNDNITAAGDTNNSSDRDISSHSDSYAEGATIENTDVFDDYSLGEKHNDFAAKRKFAPQKDYGDYFDDEPTKTSDENNADESKDASDKNTDSGGSAVGFVNSDGENVGNHASKKKNKGKVIAVVAICVIVLAAAGAIGFMIYNNAINGSDNNGATADTVTSAATESTAAAAASETTTIAAETTAPPTTAPNTSPSTEATKSSTEVTSVLGYTYEEAKQTLEAQGFTVAIWGYQYSQYYAEGYVMSQTPEEGDSVSQGDTVYLMISNGQEPSSSSSSSSESTGTASDDYLLADSSSSYLSTSQVESLSDDDLQLAINEIYARHGRIFKDASINEYFNSKSWYEGKYTADEFESNVTFNEYEQKNLQLLMDERSSRG